MLRPVRLLLANLKKSGSYILVDDRLLSNNNTVGTKRGFIRVRSESLRSSSEGVVEIKTGIPLVQCGDWNCKIPLPRSSVALSQFAEFHSISLVVISYKQGSN